MRKVRKYPSKTKEKAINLRKNGWSLGEISKELVIPKNTISGWLRGISLTSRQKQRINKKWAKSAAQGRIAAAKVLRQKMDAWKNSIRSRVAHFSNLPLESAEIGKLTCGILYICEGGKYPNTRHLTFSNSNPQMIQFFITALRRYFALDEKKFRCRIKQRYDQNPEKLRKFWSGVTHIPLSQFHQSCIDKRTKGIITAKKDYMGVCDVGYHDTNLQFELQSIGEAVLSGMGE